MRYLLLVLCIFALSVATVVAEEEPSIFWKDRQIAQLEQLTPMLVVAVKSMQSRIASVAISSITYGDRLPANFRKVATARLHQSLTTMNELKVSVCDTCSQIRTKISGSFLKISRGIADDEFRKKMSEELNVVGFLDIDVFSNEDGQISISLNAYEAKNGKIAFSKIVTGEPPKRGDYIHVYFGKMTLPVTSGGVSADHYAKILGAERMVRLTDDWSFTGGGAFLSDDNSKLTTKLGSFSGIMVDGTIRYDVFNFGGNQVSFSLIGGLGMMLITDINSPSYFKTGFSFSVAEQLTLSYNYLSMLTVDDTISVPSASILSLGWKF